MIVWATRQSQSRAYVLLAESSIPRHSYLYAKVLTYLVFSTAGVQFEVELGGEQDAHEYYPRRQLYSNLLATLKFRLVTAQTQKETMGVNGESGKRPTANPDEYSNFITVVSWPQVLRLRLKSAYGCGQIKRNYPVFTFFSLETSYFAKSRGRPNLHVCKLEGGSAVCPT
jgi:hypothetical protein